MRVAIIGSSTFPVVQCAVEIAQFIKTFPPDTEFLTRGAEGFDRFAAEAASIMGYKVTKFPGKGGAFNFERDVDIVRLADRIEAFYDAERIGEGGTGHIVEKALDARCALFREIRSGEIDPKDEGQRPVSRAATRGATARSALPRWETASFSTGLSSAVVASCPSAWKRTS